MPLRMQQEWEVAGFLRSLDATKANGNDGISARMLKSTATAIAPSKTKLFNQSIRHSCIPRCWKEAIIVPVPKKQGHKPRALMTSDIYPTSDPHQGFRAAHPLPDHRTHLQSLSTFQIPIWIPAWKVHCVCLTLRDPRLACAPGEETRGRSSIFLISVRPLTVSHISL